MKVNDVKWSLEKFLKVREEVLKDWKTGSDPLLDLKTAEKRLKSIPIKKNMAEELIKADQEGNTLIQPRAGVALLNEHLELLLHLEEAGADLLPTTIDSYTRQNRYEEAETGIQESKKQKRSMLNGFPAVNHGVEVCSILKDKVNKPLQARHGTPDSRLLAEIIHAAGWTSNEGGAISYNIPYAKNVSLEDSIFYWQYCDRLVGYYEEHGIKMNREPFGPLTGTLVPPAISNTIAIIEALLAARQGVKNITVGYGMGGNLTQDIAAMRALKEQTLSYLKKQGFNDVYVTTVFHQWMGGFPEDETAALALISYSATVASFSKATKMITKTPLESIGVPTKEANATGIKASKFIVQLLKEQTFPNSKKLTEELEQIKKEVESLMYHVYNLGDGDLAVGVVKAFENGVLDVPFAPSKFNKGAMLPARDIEGNIRILEFGNLGLNEEIKTFHREKLQERAKKEKRALSFQMTVDDIYAVSKGKLVGNPQRKEN
ncbi:MAG: methylaspartate mutase subunit E [Acholeplasmatales bacterium]|jgi:methylaspartate mutase epsilon subunit|nr:methylaspartate mutase subunit E [Acholeplasmataceae bacterium]MCK9234239.1 methylaspartate mutase subunit E [Acholeplasmataceae bacterium]MCK9289793.1 methylaspartate mutase subunit E [Acholeplasmataceae bacterium]MCK9427888.1 methylaspartate mutase subunit E [Acholeplasmataceae bacterium]MDY0114974.1 methylaspartate mutase subunit E [Acholeplasmatales bacterium]